MYDTVIVPGWVQPIGFQHLPAEQFPLIHPIDWLTSHFAVGGWSPLRRLSGMITAHMTQIAPHSGFTWHPHRGLEIFTWVLEGTISHQDTTGGKGDIGPGEFQRMFSGDWIEHEELNLTDDPVRVIQIWFAADPKYRGLEPHYQQVGSADLPSRRSGNATIYALIGDGSPIDQHMTGRLTATTVESGGQVTVELPRSGEDLFLYVTDGAGQVEHLDYRCAAGQYDVILARPDSQSITLRASPETPLKFLSFYLPGFLPSVSRAGVKDGVILLDVE